MGQNINVPKYLPLVKDYFLKNLSSMKVGGPARFFYKPCTLRELKNAVEFATEYSLPIKYLGNTTNVVFSDGGFDGIVVSLKDLKGIKIDGTSITFTCGETMQSVYETTLKHSLSGAEFFSKIPATVGGAIAMNAGAFNHTISELVAYVETLENGYVKYYDSKACDFSYRDSVFRRKNAPIIKAKLNFTKKDAILIDKLEKELFSKRNSCQPKGFSCGSVFKNPPNLSAGKLIEDCGLKGFNRGGAKVSIKHANFIINTGFATAQDVYDLTQTIKERVCDKFGVMLQEEIEFLGEF